MEKDLKNELSCEMWLNFMLNNIIPIFEMKLIYNYRRFEIAINDLIKELSVKI